MFERGELRTLVVGRRGTRVSRQFRQWFIKGIPSVLGGYSLDLLELLSVARVIQTVIIGIVVILIAVVVILGILFWGRR